MFPCQRAGRCGWKFEDCRIFGALWVDLGRRCCTIRWRNGSDWLIGSYWLGCLKRLWVHLGCRCSTNRWRGWYRSDCVIGGDWLSTLMRGRATREQALEWPQQPCFLRLLSWRIWHIDYAVRNRDGVGGCRGEDEDNQELWQAGTHEANTWGGV